MNKETHIKKFFCNIYLFYYKTSKIFDFKLKVICEERKAFVCPKKFFCEKNVFTSLSQYPSFFFHFEIRVCLIEKYSFRGVPIMAQWKWIWLATMKMQVQIPGLAQWLRIQCCCELWSRSQMQLRSGVAVAVA